MSVCFDAVIEIQGVNPFVGVSSSQANLTQAGVAKTPSGSGAHSWTVRDLPGGPT